MTELKSHQTLYWHDQAGARIRLPSQLVIQSPFPELYARVKKGLSSINVTITTHRTTRETVEQMIRGPHPSNDRQIVEVLRQGVVASPYRGVEIAVQDRIVGQPLMTYGWLRLLYLDEPSGTIGDFRVHGDGSFCDIEPLWQEVMDSFSWDHEKAVVLKMDGDERVFRARWAKKKKRREVPAGPSLPSRVSYLQPFMNELFSLPPPDEVNSEDLDLSLLHQVLERRVEGLSLGNAKARLSADRKALEAWMEEDIGHRFVVNFVLPIMQAFECTLGDKMSGRQSPE